MPMTALWRSLVCIMFVLLTSPTWASTYYATTTGSGSTCSIGSPCSLSGGVAKLTSGDTLLVAQGTYNTGGTTAISNPPSGTAGAYTIIKWDGVGSRPKLLGNQTSVPYPGTNTNGSYGVVCDIAVRTCAYIEINGFEIQDMNQGMALVKTGGTGFHHHWRILNNYIHHTYGPAINIKADLTGTVDIHHLIQGNEFSYMAYWRPGYISGENVIYYIGNNSIVEYNTVHNVMNGFGVWTSGSIIKNVILRYNLFYDIGREDIDTWQQGATGGSTAIYVAVPGGGHEIYNNVIYNSGTSMAGENRFNAIAVTTQANSTSTVKVYNNTCYNFFNAGTTNYRGYCFVDCTGQCGGTASSKAHIVKNNIAYQTPFGFYATAGGTLANNRTTDPSFINAGAGNFGLAAGSAAIDAGVAITGFAYNGSAPDQGAFETFVRSTTSCSVEAATPTKLSVFFDNNRFPPLLPATGVTGFTARKAGANDIITAAVRTGDNQIDLTLTTAIVAGNAVDISYSAGNLTDSALIGNSLNQSYVQATSNVSCVNNTAGAPSHTFTQTGAFQFYGLRGTEAAPVKTPYSTTPESTNVNVRVGGSVRLRVVVKCGGADCPSQAFYPFYSCAGCTTAGTYTVIPDTYTTDEDIAFCGVGPDPDVPTNGTATTNQLSTTGTFVPGGFVRTSNAIPSINGLNNGFKTELEYCLSFSSAATAARTYSIRLRKQDGSVLDTYTATPVMTLTAPAAGMGF